MLPEWTISEEDWNHTPPAVQALVLSLWQQVQTLQAQVEALEGEKAQLREQLGQTSRNSSRPPSSDPPHAPPRPKRIPSGRQRGGQTGHPGHGRTLKPPQQVDRVIEIKPERCAQCGALLLGEDPHPARHQVIELPEVKPEVIEYRRHTLSCLVCGAQNQAEWPSDMPTGSFGPRVQATVGYFTGQMGMSQRDMQEAMGTVFHIDLGLGTIPALEQQVSAALAEPVEEVQSYLQQQPVNHIDETGWREEAQRSWLWINTAPQVAGFWVLPHRGADEARQVLGEGFEGIVGSDRWSAYNWLDPQQRAICWAHLNRDFQAFVDRGGESEQVGQALLDQSQQMFDLWHQVKEGTLERADFQVQMEPIRARVGELLREGTTLAHDKTRRTCENILKLEEALWTFVLVEGVEPTNNDAERPLRRAVLPVLARVASKELRYPERSGESLRGARVDGGHYAAPAEAERARLSDRSVCSGSSRPASPLTAACPPTKQCCRVTTDKLSERLRIRQSQQLIQRDQPTKLALQSSIGFSKGLAYGYYA
jgi:transposase